MVRNGGGSGEGLTEVEEGDQAAYDDGAVFEELGREKGFWGEFLACFPEGEEDEHNCTDDEHGDHARVAPLTARTRSQCERKED